MCLAWFGLYCFYAGNLIIIFATCSVFMSPRPEKGTDDSALCSHQLLLCTYSNFVHVHTIPTISNRYYILFTLSFWLDNTAVTIWKYNVHIFFALEIMATFWKGLSASLVVFISKSAGLLRFFQIYKFSFYLVLLFFTPCKCTPTSMYVCSWHQICLEIALESISPIPRYSNKFLIYKRDILQPLFAGFFALVPLAVNWWGKGTFQYFSPIRGG